MRRQGAEQVQVSRPGRWSGHGPHVANLRDDLRGERAEVEAEQSVLERTVLVGTWEIREPYAPVASSSPPGLTRTGGVADGLGEWVLGDCCPDSSLTQGPEPSVRLHYVPAPRINPALPCRFCL